MKISLACDHGGLSLKLAVKQHLEALGHQVEDFGTHTRDSCDYSDFAAPAAQAVAKGQCERGIVICTTGIGVSITANKVKGIRCALLSDLMSARLTRQHNDANMMALGAGVVGEKLALEMVDTGQGKFRLRALHPVAFHRSGLLTQPVQGLSRWEGQLQQLPRPVDELAGRNVCGAANAAAIQVPPLRLCVKELCGAP